MADSEEGISGQEALFQAAANGEVATLKALIDRQKELEIDLNAKNEHGYTALQVSIMEGYVVIMKELLMMGVNVGDALLRAAEAEFELAVKCLLVHAAKQPEEDRERIINCHCEGSDFHPLLTPIMRAAQKNNFPIVKMLLDAGARIPETKRSSASSATIDSLLQSVGLVEQYSALASPTYVTQAFSDPIEKAFKLTKTLMKLGYEEVEHKLEYHEMAEKMEQLAADLISEARNSNEILTILKYSEKNGKNGQINPSVATALPKISRAITYNQKKFVAEPNCQQTISTQFSRKLVTVGDWSIVCRLLLTIGLIVCHPILSVFYKLGIGGNFREFMHTPYVKFMTQLGSDVVLLGILVARTFLDLQIMEVNVVFIGILLAYALGMGLKALSFMYYKGAKKFFSAFANYRDIVIFALLLTQCILEILQISENFVHPSSTTETTTDLPDRAWNDFEILSPAILALVNVIAFMRVMPYLIANDVVGAFQISLGDMIVNTSHFFVVLLAVLFSFATGLTYVFGTTVENSDDNFCQMRRGDCSGTNVYFGNVGYSTITLIWSLFGLIGTDTMQVPADMKVLGYAGLGLFALFQIFAILILLNALIAVMSNVYNAVEENADVEWKYSRTVLWMSFMDDAFTVPPPYNLLPDLRQIYVNVRRCCRAMTDYNRNPLKKDEMEMDTYALVDHGDYERVIKQLMDRYVTNRLATEQSATSDITPMDIRDLRNDLSSLRFDTISKLCQMEESIDKGRRQSNTIFGQSEEANSIFDRTLEIDTMVHKYKNSLVDIYNYVEKYRDCIPALEELDDMIDDLLSREQRPGLRVHGAGLVPSLVKRYEKKRGKGDSPSEAQRRRVSAPPTSMVYEFSEH